MTAPSDFRFRLFAAAALVAVASLAGASPMGESDARHLLARTGFGPSAGEVHAYAALSREQAVDKLLSEARTTSVTAPPSW